MWSDFIILGDVTREFVLSIAALLVESYTPGLVAAALVLILVISTLLYARQVSRQVRTINWLLGVVKKYDTPQSFTAAIADIDQTILQKRKFRAYKSLVSAWAKYRETLVMHGTDKGAHLRNSVRPSTFLNLDDLQYGAGFWRILPGLFVTIGLFLTFLGLVAALSVMNVADVEPKQLQSMLDTLLTTASAKFIMSLTGLFCSIIFTVVLRYGLGKLERRIHDLCARIEHLLKFISLEDMAAEQLVEIKDHRAQFRAIGLELVAELARPLREELPQTISKSIAEAMGPVIDRISKAGTEGVGSMITDLSNKFSGDVGTALANASASIDLAGQKIGDLAARMDQSSGTMSTQMMQSIAALTSTIADMRKTTEDSAARTGAAMAAGADQMLAAMSQTLHDIRDNTAAGAGAISEAAAEMRIAAAAFKDELSSAASAGARELEGQMAKTAATASGAIAQASQAMLGSFDDTAQRIAHLSGEVAEKLSADMMRPLEGLGEKFAALSREMGTSTAEFRRLADEVKASADATAQASLSLRSASQDMTSAAEPIRFSVDRLDGAVATLHASAAHNAETLLRGAQSTVQSAEAALKSASEILGSKQRAIEAALEGVKEVTERMRGQGDKLDDLDGKLGQAFEKYAQHVSASLDMMVEHARDMGEQLSPAIDTLREVVEQAERFIPQSRAQSLGAD